jgi:hypothetical protein
MTQVVGGMAWSLMNSNVDADIDVIFTENSTIGQKMYCSWVFCCGNCMLRCFLPVGTRIFAHSKISDSIVKALVKMKCPLPLQSHQIQGLDLEKLFPVMQWLVKKVCRLSFMLPFH